MAGGTFADILTHAGFRLIGSLRHRLAIEIWWHEPDAVELLVMPFGAMALLKGSKSYTVQSIAREGATYVRDINQFCDYLESHFGEMHLSISHFRDISHTLAAQHVHRKASIDAPTREIPNRVDLEEIQAALNEQRARNQSVAFAGRYLSDLGVLLRSHLLDEQRTAKRETERLKRDRKALANRLDYFDQLQRAYLQRSSAALISFSIHSNLQFIEHTGQLTEAVEHITKELRDLDRYQIRQKLGGGKLRIHIEASHDPAFHWIEQWFGGALSPSQLERFRSALPAVLNGSAERMAVTPKEDIVVNGHVRENKKPLAQRAIASVLDRVDLTEDRHAVRNAAAPRFPLTIGRVLNQNGSLGEPFQIPLESCGHLYISGTTGSGKSYAGRTLIEEATQYEDLNILVLDPRNQSAGLLVPEDREEILDKYGAFGIKTDRARGYQFEYCSPGQGLNPKAVTSSTTGTGRQIVSFKGMTDLERCKSFADLLDHAFARHARDEADQPRLLIVVEEAHGFTRRRVDDSAKSEASRAEITLDRVIREGRKFGICVVILSQTIRDFAYDAASIRQNTTTKVFLHNSDREIEYAAEFLEHGRDIVQLQSATAIAHHPARGAVRIHFRPPYSKVWEFGKEDTQQLVTGSSAPPVALTRGAQELLGVIQRADSQKGEPLHLTQLSEVSGITSKRRLHTLLSELESAGTVRTRYLASRGKPRVIELVQSDAPDEMADESWTEQDEAGGAK